MCVDPTQSTAAQAMIGFQNQRLISCRLYRFCSCMLTGRRPPIRITVSPLRLTTDFVCCQSGSGVNMIQRVAIVLLLAGACLAQDSVARMDEVAQSFVASKVFMGSVLVARDGNILFSKGYGSANLEWNIPNSPS